MQADAQSGQIGLEQGGAEAWAGIFDRCETYVAGTQRFRVYSAGIEEGKEKTTLLLLHGAGHCALSWALCAQILKPFTRVIAYDARMHGATESDSTDLSVESLVEDLTRVVEGFCPQEGDRQPPFVLIGHSLGGAIAIKAAAHANWPGLQGVILLDTVEGIAQQSFSTTASLLRMRPTFFESPDAAVQWALRSGMLANRDSAILSVPASLRSVVRQGTPGKPQSLASTAMNGLAFLMWADRVGVDHGYVFLGAILEGLVSRRIQKVPVLAMRKVIDSLIS